MEKFMLDTVVFNRLLDGSYSAELISHLDVYITHIQKDELADTPNLTRKGDLFSTLKLVDPNSIPTSSARWGIGKWGESCWNHEDGLSEKMLTRLKELDKNGGKKKNPENQARDVLISETSIRRKMILDTNDGNLSTVTKEFGGQVIAFEDFVQ